MSRKQRFQMIANSRPIPRRGQRQIHHALALRDACQKADYLSRAIAGKGEHEIAECRDNRNGSTELIAVETQDQIQTEGTYMCHFNGTKS